MRKLAFLVVGGAVWLLVGAMPAFADNGPHYSSAGTVTDRCAGCHRLHSAQAAYVLVEEEPALCYTCHGPSSTGAADDVVDGVGYSTRDRNPASVGALRGGGFQYALINSAAPTFAISDEATRLTTTSGSIPALDSGVPATSAHSVNELPQTAWGGGAFSASVNYGTANVKMTCSSCHDPHGGNNTAAVAPATTATYRILKTNPANLPTNLATTCNPGTAVSGSCNSTLPNPIGTATVRNTVTCTVEQNAGSTSKTTMCRSVIETLSAGTWSVTGAYPPCSLTASATLTCTPDLQVMSDVPTGYGTQSYTSTDYWQNLADPAISRAPIAPSTAGSSSQYATFLTNISNWCSQCHTRYQATSGKTYNYNTGDGVYTYRHRSNSASRVQSTADAAAIPAAAGNYKASPNCIQCHVAHGSNSVTGSISKDMKNPGPAGGTDGLGVGTSPASLDNRLLRIDQRGICEQCHSK